MPQYNPTTVTISSTLTNYSIGSTSGTFLYSTMGAAGSTASWGNLTGNFTVSGSNGTSWGSKSDLYVTGDAEIDGDIKWKGRSLGKLLESMEDRLAILADPDPKKLEKFAALKKAYDHYKLMEKLIGEE